METKEGAMREIEESMEGEVPWPHDASVIGRRIFELMLRFDPRHDPEVQALIARFMDLLPVWGFEDLLEHQVDYAIRLGEAGGLLQYEEMQKLLALCDEIYALECLGLKFDATLRRKYEEAVRERFRRQKNIAHVAAQHCVEEWSKDKWWYRENLRPH